MFDLKPKQYNPHNTLSCQLESPDML